jgi:hypothetical protein
MERRRILQEQLADLDRLHAEDVERERRLRAAAEEITAVNVRRLEAVKAAATPGNRPAVSALVAGSSAANNAIQAASRTAPDPAGKQAVGFWKEIADAAKKQAFLQERARQILEDIKRNTDPENFEVEVVG